MTIGQVGALSKIHINSIPLGNVLPHHLSHMQLPYNHGGAYALLLQTVTPERINAPPEWSSSLRLVNVEGTVLSEFKAGQDETLISLHTLSQNLVIAGSYFYNSNEQEPSRGQIIVFDVSATPTSVNMTAIAMKDVKGAVYALTSVEHDSQQVICAAVNTSVCCMCSCNPSAHIQDRS